MQRSLLNLLRCSVCGAGLRLDEDDEMSPVQQGRLRCEQQHEFPIERGIPRFVPMENYAANFGLQWNAFKRTQLDRFSNTTISHDRFFAQSGWTPAELDGATVLDVGCGAGRFADVALSAGATVVALDYSSAIDAAAANLGDNPRLHLVQGDVFHLPFAADSFDFVYCFGVLQHTPDVRSAFFSLPRVLRPGGKLAVDVYPRLLGNVFLGKYWVRPLVKRMPPERLFEMVRSIVPRLYPAARALARTPLVGRKVKHLLPISVYDGVFPLTEEQLVEWSVLDTFDVLAPVHDHPQSVQTIERWFHEAGLHDVEAFRLGVAVGRGRK
jgi:SAM-dependent methyltransferase